MLKRLGLFMAALPLLTLIVSVAAPVSVSAAPFGCYRYQVGTSGAKENYMSIICPSNDPVATSPATNCYEARRQSRNLNFERVECDNIPGNFGQSSSSGTGQTPPPSSTAGTSEDDTTKEPLGGQRVLLEITNGTGGYEIDPECNQSNGFLDASFPTWYKYLDLGNKNGDECAVIGPTYTDSDNAGKLNWPAVAPRVLIAIIEMLLRIAALITVGYVIYGGFRFITSQGDPESAKSARQTIQNALIGLVICLIAVGSVTFIGGQFL